MKLVVVNRKTTASSVLKLNKRLLAKLQNIGHLVAMHGSGYFMSVIAENSDDVDFIANNFCNIPIPAAPAKRAVWSGDLAVFIVTNYPKDIP